MKHILLCLCLLAMAGCSVKPEPLHFGKDACHACKMTLVDKRFGGEIVSKKGKIYKFDDINCMVGFYKSGAEPAENILSILATDFDRENALIDVIPSTFLVSDDLRTPMGSGVAAFSSPDQIPSDLKGEVETWDEIVTRF